jgi:hypothetical protein
LADVPVHRAVADHAGAGELELEVGATQHRGRGEGPFAAALDAETPGLVGTLADREWT